MKNLAFYIIAAVLILSQNTVRSQGPNLSPTIPTPNVASFTKYGEIPVSEYTGVPDISIPVYTLKDGTVDMPITLRYHASGLKVEEESDWVGLGWNLNVGGQITHIIIGTDDERCYDNRNLDMYNVAQSTLTQYPYLNLLGDDYWVSMANFKSPYVMYSAPTKEKPNVFNLFGLFSILNIADISIGGQTNTSITFPYLPPTEASVYFQSGRFVNAAKGITFAQLVAPALCTTQPYLGYAISAGYYQPDLYSFNFLNYSGKFYIRYTSDHPEGQAVLINQNAPLKIEPSSRVPSTNIAKGWKITADNGIVALFLDPIKKYNPALEYDSAPWTPATYLLSKITYPGGDTVQFVYEEKQTAVYPNNRGSESFETSIANGTHPQNWPGTLPKNTWLGAPRGDYYPKYLKTVATKNFLITFNRQSDRLDIPGEDRLTAINVKCTSSGTTKDYYFDNSDYFENTYLSSFVTKTAYTDGCFKRLKLNGFKENNGEPYRFTYNVSTNLPSKLSKAVDYWGYYNGQDNNTGMIPDMLKYLRYDINPFKASADLSYGRPDLIMTSGANRGADGQFMKANMLTKITYPTKGYTQFEFEPNTFTNFYYERSNITAYQIQASNNDSVSFTVPNFFNGNINGCINNFATNDSFANYFKIQNAYLRVYEDGVKKIEFRPTAYKSTNGFKQMYEFQPGKQYKFVSYMPTATSTSCFAKISISIYPKENYSTGAGLRVSSITNFNSNGDTLGIKKYMYGNNKWSFGKLMSPLKFFKATHYNNIYRTAGTDRTVDTYIYFSLNAGSNIPLSTDAQGSFVGYDTVLIYNRDKMANGYVLKYFYNQPCYYLGNHTAPTVPDLQNGEIISEQYFDNNNKIQKGINYNYSKVIDQFYYGFTSDFCCIGPGWDGNNSVELYYHCTAYQLPASAYRPTLVTTVDYLNDQSVSKTVSYHYNSIGQQNRILENTSNGKQKKTFLLHPFDLKGDGGLMDAMIQYNNLNPVIYQHDSIDNNRIGYTRYNYRQYANAFVPIRITQFNNKQEDSVAVNYCYDPSNLLIRSVFKDNDIKSSFIWGYNKTLPVAKIDNADTSQVYYTSFEDNGVPFTDSKNNNLAKTGKKVGLAGNFSFPANFQPPANKVYLMSYFYYKDNKWVYSGELPFTRSISVPGANYIDELRVFPAGSQMSTYAYDPLWGLTSQTDPTGVTTYYEYDSFGRLQYIKDDNGRILKSYEYHYKQ